ncbi:Dcm Site-specific DNA methylase [uncultured Caudovirales phage]|uniref:Cytosine-specific methyltransferase n=1 Tax=uncultured Caudovirales phage TaxID=2100421 RepID=A0A6J5MZ58_9CAUD|nr:Dcm Site-specific DNA methylase [uncultured Caudovirales phage]
MRYLSLCSGIEAASVAWHPLGWTPVAFSEIEPFPSAVLSHRFPSVPNLGDMTRHAEWKLAPGAVDLVVGGTPCQSFSVAGLRAGMADPRGNLALTFLAIVDRLRPEWVVFENVPGLLSSNGGRDFGAFLGALVELGFGFAYRVLDARFFGVAQRRRRVFVVANATDWRRAAAVLFESESVRRNPAKSRAQRQGLARSVVGCIDTECGASRLTHQSAANGHLVPCFWNGEQITQTLDAVLAKGQTMPEKNRFPAVLVPEQSREVIGTLCASHAKGVSNQIVERDQLVIDHRPSTPSDLKSYTATSFGGYQEGVGTIRASGGDLGGGSETLVSTSTDYAVRRLTPVECERLQGFPDDWTSVPFRGKQAADGPRYKSIGNSMAVPVVQWIGERIAAVDKVTR